MYWDVHKAWIIKSDIVILLTMTGRGTLELGSDRSFSFSLRHLVSCPVQPLSVGLNLYCTPNPFCHSSIKIKSFNWLCRFKKCFFNIVEFFLFLNNWSQCLNHCQLQSQSVVVTIIYSCNHWCLKLVAVIDN